MPWKVVPSKDGGFDIKNTNTGKVVGHSTTKAKAQASVRARYAAVGAKGEKPAKK